MLGIDEQQCCIRLHGALHLRLLLQPKKMLRKVTVLVGLWCTCSAVLRAKRVCVKTNMPEIVVFTVPSTCLYTVVPRYHEPLVKSRSHCITPKKWPFRLVNNSDCILQLSFSDPPFALRNDDHRASSLFTRHSKNKQRLTIK